MKKARRVLAGIAVAFVLAAGVCFSGEAVKFVGTILEFDRGKGEMVLVEPREDKSGPPAKKLTLMDNERRSLSKNNKITVGTKLNVTYERDGKKNVMKTYLIIPGGC